jgi:hypothetical protein
MSVQPGVAQSLSIFESVDSITDNADVVVLGRTCGGKSWSSLRQRRERSAQRTSHPLVSEVAGSGEKLKRAEWLSGEWIEIYARGCTTTAVSEHNLVAAIGNYSSSDVTP